MKVYISKQTMQSNGKRAVNGIAAVLFLLLLSPLTSVNAYQVGETFRDCETCPEMVVVPAGEFMMGSPEGEKGRMDIEGPQHQVTIPNPFAVGKYEVTVGQFTEFAEETNHPVSYCRDTPIMGSWRNPTGLNQTNNHPVLCVNWNDAQVYLQWLSAKTGQNYRLLSESEWEYAARAGTTTAYYFGSMILDNQAQYSSINGTVAVGSYPPNGFGLYDMHGNVMEWVEDCWHDDYNGAPADSSAWLIGCRKGNEDDCKEHSGDILDICKVLVVGKELRVLRSGSWIANAEILRSASRFRIDASGWYTDTGFRVARTLTSSNLTPLPKTMDTIRNLLTPADTPQEQTPPLTVLLDKAIMEIRNDNPRQAIAILEEAKNLPGSQETKDEIESILQKLYQSMQ